MKKGFIFDFDGVITDSIPFHDAAYLQLFKDLSAKIDLNYLHTTIGSTPRQVIQKVMKDFLLNKNIDEMYEEHKGILLTLYKEKAEPAPYLHEFLTKLTENNLIIGIASSTDSMILNLTLEKFGVSNYFTEIVGGEELEKGKPDPEMLLKVLTKLNIHPEDAIAIDDSKSGILAANAIHMYSIAYTKYSKKEIPEANLSINEFSDIDFNKLLP